MGAAEAQKTKEITKEMIDNASAIAGVSIDNEYKDMMLGALNKQVKGYEEIYKLHIPISVSPALLFDPVLPAMTFETARRPMRMSNAPDVEISDKLEDLAFASVRELAEIVRTKKISSMALTQMYLGRLKKYDPKLHFVVTLTEERALAQARQADAEIAAGKYRDAARNGSEPAPSGIAKVSLRRRPDDVGCRGRGRI